METGSSVWRGHWGGYGLTAVIAAAIIWGVWFYGDRIGLHTTGMKYLGFAGAMILLMLLRHGKIISLVVQQRWHRFQAKRKDELPTDEPRAAQNPPRNVTVTEIREAMRNLYGRVWFCKVRILLITGTVSEVEQLTPGLTYQSWQEDKGTLLLWGGDLNRPVDCQWLTALRKLRRRPADGMVWVTSLFDRMFSPGLPQPQPAPSESMMDTFSHALSARNKALGWQLPLYVWSLHPRGSTPKRRTMQATGCLLPADCTPGMLTAQLAAISSVLIAQGIVQISEEPQHNFLLMLANQLIQEPQSIAEPLSVLLNPYRPLPLAGIVFSQVSVGAVRPVQHHWGRDKRWDVLPDSIRELPAGLRPYQPGIRWWRVMVGTLPLLMLLSGIWMVVSYLNNRNLIIRAQTQVTLASEQKQSLADRLLMLSELQNTLARLQYRSEQGVPWYDRAGLSRNDELLIVLWLHYRDSAQPLLRDAAAEHLATQLNAFVSLPLDSPLREKMAKVTYDRLKLYLLLSHPEHMDAVWFSHTLLNDWSKREGMKERTWQSVAPSLLSFYAVNLTTHLQWRLSGDEHLVSKARALLVHLMRIRNSESSQYQKMLAEVVNQYADMRLEDMTGETYASGLFTTDDVVPGIFTRQAWEQGVQPAIQKLVRTYRDELDWVLTDSKQQSPQAGSPEALQKRLQERYFADFGSAWQTFLNSLRLNRATTLPDAIGQLALVADARQSPLVALMNTLNIQGRTGQSAEAISDSLVKSAKNLLGGENKNVDVIDQWAGVQGPLGAIFGPLWTLMDKNQSGEQAQSLQSYLTRVSQVRLRLQQITNAADPQAMAQTLAETVFQGKVVDLTETRDYGSLIAAVLGQELSCFGQTVFVQPMEQAWQLLLIPAAKSLNAQWQQAMVSDWNSAFGGRYPFSDASSEVSLPLLEKYLNTDAGRIAQFLQRRLNGVLRREGSRWVPVPDSINSQKLSFNPCFLKAINILSQLSDVAFPQGNAGMHFELRPGTASGVMQTEMIIDAQKLTYVNQMPTWKRFTWPADTEAPGANLSWISTQAGTRQYADMPGVWGLIRLLDKTSVSDNSSVGSSYNLRWKAQDGRNLNYILRTEAGEGPLALLRLRNFRLPENIFSVDISPEQTPLSDTEDKF